MCELGEDEDPRNLVTRLVYVFVVRKSDVLVDRLGLS